MRFYTLIHICEEENSIHNNSFVRDFDDQINLYFTCAKQLHRSLQQAGKELVVLTNNKGFLKKLNRDNYAIEILELNFNLQVPSGIHFYSQLFKVELFKHLATFTDDYIGLIDCDMICINPLPPNFENIIEYKFPMYYDITDQVTPAYGADTIVKDKQKLNKMKSVGLWSGGEFLAGPPAFFEVLYQEILKIKDEYSRDFKTYHHQGDEMLISVAIENLRLHNNVKIIDAGALSIIARYWSPKTLHVQKPIKAYAQHFLLHMPSDKRFIAGLKTEELKKESFFKTYKQHLLVTRMLETTFKGLKPYVKQARKKLSF